MGGVTDTRGAMTQEGELEVTVVMPCLNEAETLRACIEKALAGIADSGARGEVVIADNGSTDGSPGIARAAGARVVVAHERGYGSALMAGIAAARGTYVIMGDADDSYDFRQIPRFMALLREGYEFVQGCRLPSGGGTIMPGAMPFLHRWWGNPMFSAMARRWFRAPIHDVNCGLRGFSRAFYQRLRQRCTGMEFANEMVIKMSLAGARIGEVPITLHKDGRTAHPPHLRTWRDGWRTLRFYLLLSPRWLFLWPGLGLMAGGVLAYILGFVRAPIGVAVLDVNTMLFGLLPADPRLVRTFQRINLEVGLVVGAMTGLAGLAFLLRAILAWRAAGFGALDTSESLRLVIPGSTLALLGLHIIFASFFLSILGMQKRVAGSAVVVSAEGLGRDRD
jgi:glycosyltransferase involved in cell wall biosynthesis